MIFEKEKPKQPQNLETHDDVIKKRSFPGSSPVLSEEKNSKDQSHENEDSPCNKRIKIDLATKVSEKSSTSETESSLNSNNIPIVDVCATLSAQPITRIEVKWDLITETVNGNSIDATDAKESRWWGANLLPHDETSYHILQPDPEDEIQENERVGCDEGKPDQNVEPKPVKQESKSIKVPIRILDYDPYPSGGFHDREISRVVFLNEHSLMDVDTSQALWFRVDGSTWEEGMPHKVDELVGINGSANSLSNPNNTNSNSLIPLQGEEGLRSILDAVLSTALQKSGVQSKMSNMTAAQQCFMADRIVQAKEKMLSKLLKANTENGVDEITPEHVRLCMEEIGTEGI